MEAVNIFILEMLFTATVAAFHTNPTEANNRAVVQVFTTLYAIRGA